MCGVFVLSLYGVRVLYLRCVKSVCLCMAYVCYTCGEGVTCAACVVYMWHVVV